ncbi:MAG: hypothetical protein AB1758_04455 [Candidatus Eremiobacterota bacterium]
MEETLLLEKLHDLKKRLRLVWMIQSALAWCFPGAVVTLALVVLLKALDRPAAELTLATCALALFPLGGAVAAGLRKLPLLGVALAVDRRLMLKERLTTALEWVTSDRPRTVVAQRLIRDASQHATGIDPRNTFAVAVPASLRRAAIVSGLVTVLLLLPPWHLIQTRQNPEEIRAVHAASDRLVRKAQELRRQHPRSERAKETADRLEDLAKRLNEPGTDRQEAAARVNNLAEQLRSQSRGQGKGQNPGGADRQVGTGTSSERAERLRQLARKARKEGASPGLSREIQKELSKAEKGSQEEKALKDALKKSQEACKNGKCDGEGASEALSQAAEAAENQGLADQGMAQEVADTLQSVESELSQESASQQQGRPGQDQAPSNPGGKYSKGKGKAPADYGVGTTHERGNPPSDGGQNYVLNRQSDKKSEWTEEYKRLYASERVHRDTQDTAVKGDVRPGQMLPGQGQVRGAPRSEPGAGGGSEEVYLEYKREAEEAVTRQNVPAEYRDLVRDYFDGIDPRQGE